MCTLEEKRKFCSEYIQQHFGKDMDSTPWWDKWRIIGTYKAIKENENAAKVYNIGQDVQEAEERIL